MAEFFTERHPTDELASTFSSVFNWWVQIPGGATPQERRTYNMYAISQPAGLVSHLFLILLFAYWGIPELVIANIFSVLLWATSTATSSNFALASIQDRSWPV